MCNKRQVLGADADGEIKASNWYRHVGACIKKRESGPPPTPLTHFFSQKSNFLAPQLKHAPPASTSAVDEQDSPASMTTPNDTLLVTGDIQSASVLADDPTFSASAENDAFVTDETFGDTSVLPSAVINDEAAHKANDNQVFRVAPPITKQ